MASLNLILEGQVKTSTEWKNVFNENGDNDYFRELVEKAALKRVAQKTDHFRLDFVGLIAFENRSIVCVPKIYDGTGARLKASDLSKLVSCIQKYGQRVRTGINKSGVIEGNAFFDNAGPMLNVFIALMAWTRDHGIHIVEGSSLSDAYTNIDWSYTFDNATAIHLKTGPVYTELFGFSEVQFESRLGLIQSIALLELHTSFGLVAELWASKFDPALEECDRVRKESSFSPLSELDMYDVILDAELHTTRDHDKELVNLLRRWLDCRGEFHAGLQLYGVNAFHVIWEDMCSVALGAELGAPLHGKIASQAQHKINGKVITLSIQRPDQILVEGSRIWIADAKWYRATLGEYPPLPDVIKQLMYSLTITDEFDVASNCFVLPVYGAPTALIKLGDTRMILGGVVDARFPAIILVGGEWDVFLDRYLTSSASSSISDQFKRLFP